MKTRTVMLTHGTIQFVGVGNGVNKTILRKAMLKWVKTFPRELGDIEVIFNNTKIFASNY